MIGFINQAKDLLWKAKVDEDEEKSWGALKDPAKVGGVGQTGTR